MPGTGIPRGWVGADFTFAPLSPTAFLDRAEAAFAQRIAVVDGDKRFTYGEFGDRCRRVVSALAAEDIGSGDRVAALCVNSYVMLEIHHAVPARGAVLVPVNIRLSYEEMRHILTHSGATLLLATSEFDERARQLSRDLGIRLVVADGDADEYEAWLHLRGREHCLGRSGARD